MSAEIITPAEEALLNELVERIEANKNLIGRDLARIREARLYRFTHPTFEAFCQEKWGMGRRYINMQINASEVIQNLGTNGSQNLPIGERQARPLAKLPAEQQPAAWEKAQEIAKEEGKPVAARHVEAAVAEVMPKTEEPETVVVDGTTEERKPISTRNLKILHDDGMAIFSTAKSVMERIDKNDSQRVEALNAMIAYCEKRLNSKS